jgi:hypothetical protein
MTHASTAAACSRSKTSRSGAAERERDLRHPLGDRERELRLPAVVVAAGAIRGDAAVLALLLERRRVGAHGRRAGGAAGGANRLSPNGRAVSARSAARSARTASTGL